MSGSEQHMVIDEATLMAYINGELTTSQIKSVQNWLKASEKHRQDFEQLRKTWEASGRLDPKPVVVNTDLAWESVKSKIKQVAKPVPHKKSNHIIP
ncbi:MAG: hypothetical protein R3279_08745, partial [Putridiphycobacter sp.]|nr:hypothetical protein [Putridiphycobacter sp.]